MYYRVNKIEQLIMEKNILVFAAAIELSLDSPSGIMKKVFSEAKVLEDSFDVFLWGFNKKSIIFIHNGIVTVVARYNNSFEKRRLFFSKIVSFTRASGAVAFYYRYSSCDLILLKALRELSSNKRKCVLEIPTYPYKREYMNTIKNRILYILDWATRWRLKRYVDRVVNFTRIPKRIFGIPCIATTNGFDFHSTSVVSAPSLDPIRLIAVSSMLPHHGYDRIIKGAKHYHDTTKSNMIKLYLVGDGPELHKYKKMVEDYHLEDIVVFSGRLNGKSLDDLFDISTAAISSLGLHRLGLSVVSTLKIREYVSRGLPVIYSTTDEVLEGKSFGLEFPADESPIDLDTVIAFVKSMYQNKDINNQIRKETFDLCDMTVVMKPVKDYILSSIETR